MKKLLIVLTACFLFTLTACTKQYKVTFMNGNEEVASYIVKANENSQVPSDPKKAGYVFNGWDGDTTAINKDTVINALFRRMTFKEEYSYYLLDEGNVPETWTWFNKDEYAAALDNSKFVVSDFQTIKSKIENGDKFAVYFGFNPELYRCPYCLAALPVANEAAISVELDQIYYLDIYQMRTANTDEYQWLYNLILEQIPEFGSRISVPDYFVFADNKIKSHHAGTLIYQNDEGKTSSRLQMDAAQRLELLNIYKELFTLAK